MSDEQKVWTYGQMLAKVRQDSDLAEEDPDETFIKEDEFIGYFNEGIDQAEAEIHDIDEDYFLTSDFLPQVAGQSEYDLPANIYARKFRGIMYESGSTIYPVKKFRRNNKFDNIASAEEFSTTDDYRYYITNNSPNGRKMVIVPASAETAVLSPLTPVATYIRRWYLRNANRIPLIGDYTNTENLLPAAVNDTTDVLTVAPATPYITGDTVKLALGTSASVIPAGLAVDTVYYVIALTDTTISLATTLTLARAGTAIDITDTGSGYFTLKVAATTLIVAAVEIDIPEFAIFVMEWVKANCLYKDGDPRLVAAVGKLEQQRNMMVTSLTDSEPDDDNRIEQDMSFYQEMS
jgi:hypothetical protein